MTENERKDYFHHIDAIMSQNDTIENYRAEGRIEGERAEKLRNAKNFKLLGVDIDTISKATGLSKEEIENL